MFIIYIIVFYLQQYNVKDIFLAIVKHFFYKYWLKFICCVLIKILSNLIKSFL